MGRNSSVVIATRYGLDGPGIESRCGREFPYPSRPVVGLTQPPIQWVPDIFPGSKAVAAWRWPPTPFSAEVKESVELCFYPSGPSWPVLGRILPYFYLYYLFWVCVCSLSPTACKANASYYDAFVICLPLPFFSTSQKRNDFRKN
jgi:hypothetical protein